MIEVHQYDFVPVAYAIRVEVIGVSYCQVGVLPSCAFLRYLLEGQGSGELGYAQGLLSSSRNGSGFSRSASPHTDPDHYDPLLRLVA